MEPWGLASDLLGAQRGHPQHTATGAQHHDAGRTSGTPPGGLQFATAPRKRRREDQGIPWRQACCAPASPPLQAGPHQLQHLTLNNWCSNVRRQRRHDGSRLRRWHDGGRPLPGGRPGRRRRPGAGRQAQWASHREWLLRWPQFWAFSRLGAGEQGCTGHQGLAGHWSRLWGRPDGPDGQPLCTLHLPLTACARACLRAVCAGQGVRGRRVQRHNQREPGHLLRAVVSEGGACSWPLTCSSPGGGWRQQSAPFHGRHQCALTRGRGPPAAALLLLQGRGGRRACDGRQGVRVCDLPGGVQRAKLHGGAAGRGACVSWGLR